jgi:hypothetical protein
VITREVAHHIRADALELIAIARTLNNDGTTLQLEAIALAMLKRASALEKDHRF